MELCGAVVTGIGTATPITRRLLDISAVAIYGVGRATPTADSSASQFELLVVREELNYDWARYINHIETYFEECMDYAKGVNFLGLVHSSLLA